MCPSPSQTNATSAASPSLVDGADDRPHGTPPTWTGHWFSYASDVVQTSDLVLELLDDVRRLDEQIKTSHRRIRPAVRASGTSLTEVYGIGPIHAAEVIGYSVDVRRFTNRDAFASYNGTAPIEWSSGGRIVHRLSRRAIARSTTLSTWSPSPRSAIPGPRVASLSSARSPRARPRRGRLLRGRASRPPLALLFCACQT